MTPKRVILYAFDLLGIPAFETINLKSENLFIVVIATTNKCFLVKVIHSLKLARTKQQKTILENAQFGAHSKLMNKNIMLMQR